MDERSTFRGALIASAVAVLFCAQVAVPMAAAEEAHRSIATAPTPARERETAAGKATAARARMPARAKAI